MQSTNGRLVTLVGEPAARRGRELDDGLGGLQPCRDIPDRIAEDDYGGLELAGTAETPLNER